MPKRNEILTYQKIAGDVLSQICAVSGVKSSEFCDTLSQFLGNIDVQTVEAYFRKVPYKYIVPEDGYASFMLAVTDMVTEICATNPWGEKGRKTTQQNWAEYGEALLGRMDTIHKRAFIVNLQNELEQIDKFLEN